LGNSVLYELCKDHPLHLNDEEIIAKIWLIGRAYHASIERRKTNDGLNNDNFYIYNVAPKIKNSDIDIWIQHSREKNIENVLQAHQNVTALFNNISSLDKRSLASKYLHFHVPDTFYIYDSRAARAIGRVLKICSKNKFIIDKNEHIYDDEYTKFYHKCIFVQNFIKSNYGVVLDCTSFDNLLIEVYSRKLKILTK
jgi:hypothetical protein